MFKFVNADASGSTPKRQQSQRACTPCRKRKKRCPHHDPESRPQPIDFSPPDSPDSDAADTQPESFPMRSSGDFVHPPSVSDVPPNQSLPPPSRSPLPQQDALLQVQSTLDNQARTTSDYARNEILGARFIGDLNPESVFLAASSPDATRGVSMEDSVGVWLRSTLNKRLVQSGNIAEIPQSSLFFGSTSLVQEALLPLLEQECLTMLPPPKHLEELSKIYFERMQPIFPVIDMEEFCTEPATHCSTLLQQAICLAASKSFAARPHLFLAGSETVLNPMDFGDRISRVMRLSMEMGLVTDKIVLIQALALMSQFFDSSDRGDLASQFCAKAVHHVHSIGLQVKVRQGEAREQYGATLLCCVWAIDRMNAAFNGRPVLMHERDVRRDMNDCFQQQTPPFRLFLQVIILLDKIIDLYRPSAVVGAEFQEPYPSFEELVVRCDGELIGTWSLATIEILYHAVAILSYRSKTLTDAQRPTNAYLRQILSTSSLTSTVGQEIKDVVLFPFVPYALSLALSVTYREMRYGKISLHRARARKQFQSLSDALTELKTCFRSASYIADMGSKLLKEMERVVSNVSGTKTPSQPLQVNGISSQPAEPSRANIPASLPNIMPTIVPTTFPQVQSFDSTIFDPSTDMDLFGMFDPGFNLDNFDAYLESTLNPSFPISF